MAVVPSENAAALAAVNVADAPAVVPVKMISLSAVILAVIFPAAEVLVTT